MSPFTVKACDYMYLQCHFISSDFPSRQGIHSWWSSPSRYVSGTDPPYFVGRSLLYRQWKIVMNRVMFLTWAPISWFFYCETFNCSRQVWAFHLSRISENIVLYLFGQRCRLHQCPSYFDRSILDGPCMALRRCAWRVCIALVVDSDSWVKAQFCSNVGVKAYATIY